MIFHVSHRKVGLDYENYIWGFMSVHIFGYVHILYVFNGTVPCVECHLKPLKSSLCLPYQATVIKQDSILEFYLRETSMVPETHGGRVVRSLSRDGGTDGGVGELTLLQRQHSLLQEELVRLRGADGRLRDCEKHRAQLERQLKELKHLGDSSGTAATQQVSGLGLESLSAQMTFTVEMLNQMFNISVVHLKFTWHIEI